MLASHTPHRQRRWLIAVPLLLFVTLLSAFFWNARGDDLASSFVGCRVLAAGDGASLYSYDPVNFAGIADTNLVWPALAAQGGYGGWLHPYVQTPLWAWMLRPVCTSMQWRGFLHLFLILSLLCTGGMVYLAARFWAPRLASPLALTLVLGLMTLSEPFLFAMVLVQTHALLLFLTVAGLVLAQRDRPVLAGFAVACAAAIKITPGVLLLYWLAGRQWRAALSLVVWSTLLLVTTRIAVGAALFHAFLENMHRVSRVLLVSENNQSLAAWYMGRLFSPDEVFDVNAFALPTVLRQVSTILMVAFATLGGWMDRRSEQGQSAATGMQVANIVPFGAAIALLAMTLFAPIAWSHYFIVLVVPFMLLVQAALASPGRRTKAVLWSCVTVAALLLYRPLAPDVIRMDLGDWAVLRGEFYAGVLCLSACFFAWGSGIAAPEGNRER